MIRKLLAASLLLFLVVLTSSVIQPTYVSAADCGGPEACARAAKTCSDDGGVWDGESGQCVTGAREPTTGCEDSASFFLGLPTWYKYLELDGNCEIAGPFKSGTDELDWQKAGGLVALAIVEILTRLAAIVAVGYVIYGGFRYITSQGEPDNTKSARQTIQNGLIGLVIALIATASVAFIAKILTS